MSILSLPKPPTSRPSTSPSSPLLSHFCLGVLDFFVFYLPMALHFAFSYRHHLCACLSLSWLVPALVFPCSASVAPTLRVSVGLEYIGSFLPSFFPCCRPILLSSRRGNSTVFLFCHRCLFSLPVHAYDHVCL
jgi:hypothetical protein